VDDVKTSARIELLAPILQHSPEPVGGRASRALPWFDKLTMVSSKNGVGACYDAAGGMWMT